MNPFYYYVIAAAVAVCGLAFYAAATGNSGSPSVEEVERKPDISPTGPSPSSSWDGWAWTPDPLYFMLEHGLTCRLDERGEIRGGYCRCPENIEGMC